jgi:hypothetical protein
MAKHKYIESPEQMLNLWDEYKAQVGVDEIEQVTNKGEIITVAVKKPLLRSGFEAFVFRKLGFGVSQYIDNNAKLYDEYIGVISCMKREWETDQITGTLTGKYKAPNLVARLNGLTDKVDQTTNGESINQPINVTIVKGDGD